MLLQRSIFSTNKVGFPLRRGHAFPSELSWVSPLAGLCCSPELAQPTPGQPRAAVPAPLSGHPHAQAAVLTHGKPPPLLGSRLSNRVCSWGGGQGAGLKLPPHLTSESSPCHADGETEPERKGLLRWAPGAKLGPGHGWWEFPAWAPPHHRPPRL